jgi:hypothetical protein
MVGAIAIALAGDLLSGNYNGSAGDPREPD